MQDERGVPRVAVLARRFPPEYTGAGIQLAAVLEQLCSSGPAITVLTGSPGPTSGPDEARLRVQRFPARGTGIVAELGLGLRVALWLSRNRDWDLLHMIDFTFASIAPRVAAWMLRRPVLVKTTLLREETAESGPRTGLLQLVRRTGYRSAHVVVALSDALERELRAGIRKDGRILRIPNGVDTDRFRPARAGEKERVRDDLGIPEGAFVVATSGMRIARKNAVALVEAVAALERRPVDVLVVGPEGGDPGYEGRLRAAIAALPAGVNAHLLGGVPVERVAELLRAADVYVLPSRAEGLPNSILEAMATGLPCVATDVPGSRDVLSQGGGVLVARDDVPALAESLDALASDPERRRRLAEEALRLARERYALERVAERYRAAYEKMLAPTDVSGARYGSSST
jgi:glycosyltransferase involved in cell wall biosynthesis